MERKFLKDLGVTDDAIDKIMAENGKDINAEKAKTEGLQGQLSTAQTTLKSFEGVDIKDLQGKVQQLTNDLAAKDTEHQKKLAEIEFGRTLESAVAGAKPKNVKAVMALLDAEKLKESKNQQADIATALEAVRKDNDYLFEPATRVSGPTPGPQNQPPEKGSTAEANNALRSLFGKGE